MGARQDILRAELAAIELTFSMALRKGRVLRRWYRSAKMYGLIKYAALSDSRNAWKGNMWRHPGPASRSLVQTKKVVRDLLAK